MYSYCGYQTEWIRLQWRQQAAKIESHQKDSTIMWYGVPQRDGTELNKAIYAALRHMIQKYGH